MVIIGSEFCDVVDKVQRLHVGAPDVLEVESNWSLQEGADANWRMHLVRALCNCTMITQSQHSTIINDRWSIKLEGNNNGIGGTGRLIHVQKLGLQVEKSQIIRLSYTRY